MYNRGGNKSLETLAKGSNLDIEIQKGSSYQSRERSNSLNLSAMGIRPFLTKSSSTKRLIELESTSDDAPAKMPKMDKTELQEMAKLIAPEILLALDPTGVLYY